MLIPKSAEKKGLWFESSLSTAGLIELWLGHSYPV